MAKKLRSSEWFNNPKSPIQTAIYLERYLNYGLKKEDLQSGKPIIGIAQTGSDLVPCNRHLLDLSKFIKAGIRSAGGVPMEFPTHPIQETGKRPTAALDRNLSYLSLVEVLYGYPIDGVVFTTGCDKTTPAALMAAATVNLPSIIYSGGPMINGYYKSKISGAGTIIWEGKKLLASNKINYKEFMQMVISSSPGKGHCNTIGTASSMNIIAESLGMALPNSSCIPATYDKKITLAKSTGVQIVEAVKKDLTPKKIINKKSLENAVKIATALGASTNCPYHLIAIAKAANIKFNLKDWEKFSKKIPLLVNCQPSGKFLMEDFYKAGGTIALMQELKKYLNLNVLTVTGKKLKDNINIVINKNEKIIKKISNPIMKEGGIIFLKGNFFKTAIMKQSVIDDEFRKRYLLNNKHPGIFFSKAVVFEGPEDYEKRIDSKSININKDSILIMRGCGPIGYPGSAEVINMQPPKKLIKQGINVLPTMGDGRQSGTSRSPSILQISPESAVGGFLSIIKNNDEIKVDLNKRRVDVLITKKEMNARIQKIKIKKYKNQTPWQEISREYTSQLEDGANLNTKEKYFDLVNTKGIPRHSH
jgi:dihydroxy-acid dehydratase